MIVCYSSLFQYFFIGLCNKNMKILTGGRNFKKILYPTSVGPLRLIVPFIFL